MINVYRNAIGANGATPKLDDLVLIEGVPGHKVKNTSLSFLYGASGHRIAQQATIIAGKLVVNNVEWPPVQQDQADTNYVLESSQEDNLPITLPIAPELPTTPSIIEDLKPTRAQRATSRFKE